MAIGNRALNDALTAPDPGFTTTPDRIEIIISSVLGLLVVAASAWFSVQFLIGAINWIGSRGDKAAVQSARNHIMHAVLGLGIISVSYIIITLLDTLLGIRLIDIGATFRDLNFF